MNGSLLDRAGIYIAEFQVAYVRAGRLVRWLLVGGWIAFPFGLLTLLHPSDAFRVQYFVQHLQHLPAAHIFTWPELVTGFVKTVVALAVLVILQLVGAVLFYRRAQLNAASIAAPVLWPAALLVGIVGNAIWLMTTSYVDAGGFLAGISATALTVWVERLCEGFGRDFVLGVPSGPHP